MLRPVEHEVLIGFVVHVIQPAAAAELGSRRPVTRARYDRARRIVWRDRHDRPGAVCDPLGNGRNVKLIIVARRQRAPAGRRAIEIAIS